jgi:hypothetical protein
MWPIIPQANPIGKPSNEPLLFNSVHAIIIEKIRDDYGLY